jgi:uncharacterized cupin superfamily protein
MVERWYTPSRTTGRLDSGVACGSDPRPREGVEGVFDEQHQGDPRERAGVAGAGRPTGRDPVPRRRDRGVHLVRREVHHGFWRREPDTWSFERPYDEVALILTGRADIEAADGAVVSVGPGDVLITPRGSSGTWRITETIVKFYAISSPETE